MKTSCSALALAALAALAVLATAREAPYETVSVGVRPRPAEKEAADVGHTHTMPRIELLRHLTDPARYNRHVRPLDGVAPLNVTARTFIYMLQSVEGRLHMELKMTMKQEFGFTDPRLRYADVSPGTWELTGDDNLSRLLWTPHVFLANERQSVRMGAAPHHDVLVRVSPDGHVLFVTRVTVSVVCSMKHGRFPFDEQECPMYMESWLDDVDELQLRWAGVSSNDRLSLDSFSMMGWDTEELQRSRITVNGSYLDEDYPDRFGSMYSSLKLTFMLSRQYGFFIMDYYVPSVLLVITSWVTFWLDPDIVPARVLLGSSTMLTFITLAVQTDRTLPVSYFKASEIWFVGCCTFIFGSLVEFAFVNTIWRQGQSVDLKKVSTKHILRSTLGTPKPPRRRLLPQERYARRRTSSLPDLFKPQQAGGSLQAEPLDSLAQAHPSYFNTIHAGALRPSPLASVCESAESVAGDDDDQADTVSEGGRPGRPSARRGSVGTPRSSPSPGVTFDSAATLAAEEHDSRPKFKPQVAGTRRQSLSATLANSVSRRLASVNFGGIAVTLTPGFTRMSASEVADWIDRRSRVFFPFAFLVFNIVYWTFVIYI
ncbi:glycine receptor subunit alpha-1-like isoform X2 [Thrips palmi]|uniref:Glycine receptor subunit alpha-1-like isoform X2 n=1 Tax=Thrips palmi TaxID=161013 RepID=A0A6P8ZN63_THRPL|nr:glycine receptor subunit alpha-1-like isoform X2 [Thrips palmi]